MTGQGYLSDYFEGVAAKYLKAGEVDPGISHQHEFNGVTGLKKILGPDKRISPARFLYLGNSEEEFTETDGSVTWYDARKRHPSRSEYRLYYSSCPVMDAASEGDLMIIGRRPGNRLLVIVARSGTTFENHLLWLFGVSPEPDRLFTLKEYDRSSIEIGFAARQVLAELGIEVEYSDERWLDTLLEKFGSNFPGTREFSLFARQSLQDTNPADGPDEALVKWLEHEEMLFRTLERHIVGERLKNGFLDSAGKPDVDTFISFSLSVQNRRKSRIGQAFENHLEQIFIELGIWYSRGQKTENRSRPDFVFPGISYYHDALFPAEYLTMLGAKSTCKDRWRQVLSEAARIRSKHLVTLEQGISENQTDEMRAHDLQLVVPCPLHETYSNAQREWLMDVSEFVAFVKERQKECGKPGRKP